MEKEEKEELLFTRLKDLAFGERPVLWVDSLLRRIPEGVQVKPIHSFGQINEADTVNQRILTSSGRLK